ncbi:MAG: hypothetical protein EVJ46_09635 [Candidatus Acididesulfobacter guangdongensis]|uniref:Uncharacterized protein n=1 Tax=Acididesulfobacter guangdongensis TaxID=2597225 RepID=A0A519BES3_ACIG2|nr:MAG: hypothetical protein EVJ46_09635 [Candidatus Acididesulfobacter guangdongensis]
MPILKKENEITIRAFIDKNVYDKALAFKEKALKEYNIRLSVRDIIKKGLSLKEDELSRVKVVSYTEPELFERYIKIKEKNKNLEVGDIICAGLRQSLNEFKKIINE